MNTSIEMIVWCLVSYLMIWNSLILVLYKDKIKSRDLHFWEALPYLMVSSFLRVKLNLVIRLVFKRAVDTFNFF